jgi:hypothetical protein
MLAFQVVLAIANRPPRLRQGPPNIFNVWES